MNREERECMVDRLLNEALAPQEIEPRPGLENRIVASLRAQPESRRRWAWWAIPALAAALIALAIGLRTSRHPHHPVSRIVAIEHPATPATPPKPAVPSTPVLAQHRRPVIPQHRPATAETSASLPRQSVFPAPVALTPEEQMLMTMARHNPSGAVLLAHERASDWERILKNFETGAAVAPHVAPENER